MKKPSKKGDGYHRGRDPRESCGALTPTPVASILPPTFKGPFLGFKKTGPQNRVSDQWFCPNRSTGVMENWRIGVLMKTKEKSLTLSDFLRGLFSGSDEKRGSFHYSNTPVLRRSLDAGKLNPLRG
jgi:hypothetical protein